MLWPQFPGLFISRVSPRKTSPENSPSCCCVGLQTHSGPWRELHCGPGPVFILGRNLWVKTHSS